MIEEIIKMYYNAILKYCRAALNGNYSAAEDVTQEVFLALHRKMTTLTIDQNIKLWLYRAADFEIKKYIKKHPSHIPLDELPEEMLPSNEDSYDLEVSDSLSCLTVEDRKLLTDYYTSEDKSEVAREHRIGIDVLYVRIHRIRRRLADYLSNTDKIGT